MTKHEIDLETRGIALAAQMLYAANNMQGFQLLREEVRKRTGDSLDCKQELNSEKERDLNPVLHYCGRPVASLTREELIAAMHEINQRLMAIDHNPFGAEVNSEVGK